DVYCPDTAIFEAVHILHQRAGAPRSKAAVALMGVVEMPCLHMAQKPAIITALDFWVQQSPLDYADCYHLALTKALGMMRICTFDKKMDRYPGVERIGP